MGTTDGTPSRVLHGSTFSCRLTGVTATVRSGAIHRTDEKYPLASAACTTRLPHDTILTVLGTTQTMSVGHILRCDARSVALCQRINFTRSSGARLADMNLEIPRGRYSGGFCGGTSFNSVRARHLALASTRPRRRHTKCR